MSLQCMFHLCYSADARAIKFSVWIAEWPITSIRLYVLMNIHTQHNTTITIDHWAASIVEEAFDAFTHVLIMIYYAILLSQNLHEISWRPFCEISFVHIYILFLDHR